MLNELKEHKNLDVYVTGSNSKGLSKDIATQFRGRATQIHVFRCLLKNFIPLWAVKNEGRWIPTCSMVGCRVLLHYLMSRTKRLISVLYSVNYI